MQYVAGLEYICGQPPRDALVVLRERLNVAIKMRFVERGWRLCAAESITGGKLADYLIRVAGASEYFVGSVVAYQFGAKANLLGVSRRFLEERGAVNEEVASQMAEGARRLFESDWAVAVTGVAGPQPGSHGEPVGTIWAGVTNGKFTTTACASVGPKFRRGRERLRMSAVHFALATLWKATGESG
ncbi:MAG: CinA family protein [bacterium JZ-2024 1]